MENILIEKISDDFVKSFPYVEKDFDTVVGCCKRNNINPALFVNNLFYLTGQKTTPTQHIFNATKSLIPLLSYIPPTYPLTFVAAFPDVVMWFMNSYDASDYADNIYFDELKNNQNKYFDEQMKANYKFILILIVAFRKINIPDKFECSF